MTSIHFFFQVEEPQFRPLESSAHRIKKRKKENLANFHRRTVITIDTHAHSAKLCVFTWNAGVLSQKTRLCGGCLLASSIQSVRSYLDGIRAITLSCALVHTIRLSRGFSTQIQYVNVHHWARDNIIVRPRARDKKI
jgi:diaminopimelate epimerase